jgi:hypothetical protein
MTKDKLATSERRAIRSYEEVVPVRGCRLSMENIRDFYRDVLAINKKFGEQIILGLPRDKEMTDEQWEEHKTFLLDEAFCLSVGPQRS